MPRTGCAKACGHPGPCSRRDELRDEDPIPSARRHRAAHLAVFGPDCRSIGCTDGPRQGRAQH